MNLIILSSSSHGNCYLLHNDEECLIIECGIRFEVVKKTLNFNISKICGCLISHSHSDHSKYIKNFISNGIKVYSSQDTFENLKIVNHNAISISPNKKGSIGNFNILAFELKHDVTCYGFLIYHEEMGLICFITDTHYVPFKFPGLNHVLIECNYDQEILDNNILNGKFPQIVRNRVMNSHISIQTCKEFLNVNDLSNVYNIILLHLSDGNSNANQFKNDIERLTGIKTYIADKNMTIELYKNPF